MRKADAYRNGMYDALEPFSEQLNQVADEVHGTSELLDDIIDCIEWNVDNPEELVNKLKAKKAKRVKPHQFRISIVYSGKENENLADALRKDLNNQKHTCEKVDYFSFIRHAGSLVDYRIYIGNHEKAKEENGRIIYKAYGMRILEMDCSYVVEYDPKHKFTEDNKEKFILYYESVISKSLEKSKAAEKALKTRKKRKLANPNGSEPKGTYSVMEALSNSAEFWEDKPVWMTLILGLPSMLVSLVAMVFLIPVGIGELALRDTIGNLREANFDSKFVADAQRQILEVKMVDLFMSKQINDIYDNNPVEPSVLKKEDNISVHKPMQMAKPTTASNANKASNASDNTIMQQSVSAEIKISSIIKELVRRSSPDALRVQIEGKVLEGMPTVGSYCKLEGQQDMYQIMTIGYAGNLTEIEVGRSTKFTLKKI